MCSSDLDRLEVMCHAPGMDATVQVYCELPARASLEELRLQLSPKLRALGMGPSFNLFFREGRDGPLKLVDDPKIWDHYRCESRRSHGSFEVRPVMAPPISAIMASPPLAAPAQSPDSFLGAWGARQLFPPSDSPHRGLAPQQDAFTNHARRMAALEHLCKERLQAIFPPTYEFGAGRVPSAEAAVAFLRDVPKLEKVYASLKDEAVHRFAVPAADLLSQFLRILLSRFQADLRRAWQIPTSTPGVREPGDFSSFADFVSAVIDVLTRGVSTITPTAILSHMKIILKIGRAHV